MVILQLCFGGILPFIFGYGLCALFTTSKISDLEQLNYSLQEKLSNTQNKSYNKRSEVSMVNGHIEENGFKKELIMELCRAGAIDIRGIRIIKNFKPELKNEELILKNKELISDLENLHQRLVSNYNDGIKFEQTEEDRMAVLHAIEIIEGNEERNEVENNN
jgi:hypothetical protein